MDTEERGIRLDHFPKSKAEIEKMHVPAGCSLPATGNWPASSSPGSLPLKSIGLWRSTLRSHGAKPEQKGYMGYPYATCCSKNDVVCHGMPDETPLREGDIVTIDMVVNIDGWLADSAWTYPVGHHLLRGAPRFWTQPANPFTGGSPRRRRATGWETFPTRSNPTPKVRDIRWSASLSVTESVGECTKIPKSPTSASRIRACS